jgi:hypothetical protein
MLVVIDWILGHVVRRSCFCAAVEVDIKVDVGSNQAALM